MQRLLFNGKYITLSALITTFALACLWNTESAFWGLLFWLLYLLFFGYYLGVYFLPKERHFWQIIFGLIGFLGIWVSAMSAVYWFFEINRYVISVLLVLLPFAISLQKMGEEDLFADLEAEIDLESYVYIRSHLATKLLALFVILGDILLFVILFQRRFDDTLISPWTIIGPRFFILFAIVSAILLWVLQKSKSTSGNIFLIVLHTTLLLNVALIIFKFGFGFDPFIHQATEKWIAEHGFILPKQPYYIGQYVLVVSGFLISHLRIDIIDRLLVPAGAGILLPLISYFSLSRNGYKDKLSPALALIPLLPLVFFISTTPNNLALLIAFITFLWIWYEQKQAGKKTFLFGFILCLTAITIHPFIGLPTLIIYLGFQMWHRMNVRSHYLFLIPYSLFPAFILPLALYLNSLRTGQPLSFQNPFQNLGNFILLFKRPYWIWIDKGTFLMQALYRYRDFIKPLAVIGITIGIIVLIKKYKEKISGFMAVSAVSLFISVFILSTAIKYPNVISYEQNVYPSRLLELILILLLPFLILALRELFILLRRQPTKQFLAAIVFSALLLISWYFTYPTRNQISHYTGYNVRKADLDAAQFIDNRNRGAKDYIVLANQTVSSAALKVFGFAKYFPTKEGEQYFYSIPTGGPLYQYFRKMVYEEPKRQWMEQAMDFMGVKKAFFVHTNYWAPAAEIRDKAKLEADGYWELADGRVWIYEYLSKN